MPPPPYGGAAPYPGIPPGIPHEPQRGPPNPPPPAPAGLGAWHRKQLYFEAKTLAPQTAHVQSPGRTSLEPPPPKPPGAAKLPGVMPGFGVAHRKQACRGGGGKGRER